MHMSDLSPTQTRTVDDDRPCAACGYNLRGQTAAWDRAASRWRATCPECGTTQDATSSARDAIATSPATILCISVGVFVGWTLLTWLASGESSIMNAIKASALRSSTNGRSGDDIVDSLPEMLAHVAVHGTQLAVCAVGFGIVVSLAPRATPTGRTLLACVPVAIACVVGAWLYFTGWSDAAGDPTFLLRIMSGQTGPQSSAGDGEWTFVYAMWGIGGLIAIVAARFGAAIGPRITAFVAGCYAPPDRWPAFLRDRSAR